MLPAHARAMRFVIATAHFAGLGFAVRLIEEGHEVILAPAGIHDRRTCANYALVGNGLVAKESLGELVQGRNEWRDAIWIWDENHSVDANELLRRERFKVFGGGRYADRMEHDRDACLEFVAACGLVPPPSESFNAPEPALRFLETHADRSFVCKPDHGESYDTFMAQSDDPAESNLELREHLRSMTANSPFVLQERKKGIEVNVEAWFARGEPRFAFATLESKRRLTGDLGDFGGCAFDFAFTVPLSSRLVMETVGRLFPAYRSMRYTGFGDANVILAPDGVWFLEKCERFGYNSHPDLLWTLNRDPLGKVFTSLVDGTFAPNFSAGFGASCTMYMDHRQQGNVVQFPAEVSKHLYFYDVYRESDLLLTAGYYDDVLIATGAGDSISSAWSSAISIAESVKFPGRSFRVDGDGRDYTSSPVSRYESLVNGGWL